MTEQMIPIETTTQVTPPADSTRKQAASKGWETRRKKQASGTEAAPVVETPAPAPPQEVVATESTLAREEAVAIVAESAEKAAPAARPCACGCNKPLVTAIATRRFHQGHDAILKSLNKQVREGKKSAQEIPQIAIDCMDEITFLLGDRETRKIYLTEKSRRASNAA